MSEPRDPSGAFVTVVTFLWEDEARRRSYHFTTEHVQIARRMVDRHLSLPHEFVCVTDHRIEGIRTVPIDWRKHVPGTCFVKLMMHRPDIAGLLGRRILYLDLDCVIVGSMDGIVHRPYTDAVFWRNPNYGLPKRAFYQGSMQLFTAGARSQLWTDFDPAETPKWINRRYGGAEQAWISERLDHDEATWSDADGVFGAGRLVGGQMDKGISELPANARIVFTPGNREPSQPDVQRAHPWIVEHWR